ncbi:reverse transcriptase [Trichonephila clavipes]|nr:reverse transcriptase [Trichonephila clavipes]
MPTVGPITRHLERAEVVAHFHQTTGQDFLGVYLHGLGLASGKICTLCGHSRVDADHPLQCTGLDEHPTDPTLVPTSPVSTRRDSVKW